MTMVISCAVWSEVIVKTLWFWWCSSAQLFFCVVLKLNTPPLHQPLFRISSSDGPYLKLVDYCRPIKITKREGPVLFMQLWHPEVAPIERTTAIRSIVSNKEKQDALAKIANAGAAAFETTHKEWRTDESYASHHCTNVDVLREF